MKKYFLFFFASAIIFLTHYAFSGQAVYGDGIDYWAYLHSIYFDHDLNFENEYKHTYSPENNNNPSPDKAPEVQKTRITSIGKTDNLHPPGTAIIWLPVFILADIISLFFRLPRNGYADIYQVFAGLWSVALVIVALRLNELLVYKFVKDKKISFLSTLGIFVATPLLYYGSYDILNSHFASFFLSSLVLYLLLVLPISLKTTLMLGASIGMSALIRLQEALLLVPAIIYFYKKYKSPNLKILNLLLSWTIIILPLPFIWLYLYGKPVPETYGGLGLGGWVKFGSLFHFTNGFFFRTPILLFSLIGIKYLLKKDKLIFLLFSAFFVLQYLLITFQAGWVASSYGGRMYISSLPFFAILLGYTLKSIQQKWNYRYSMLIVILFSVINLISIFSFVLLEKEVNSGKKRGLEEHTQQKVERLIEKYIK